MRKEKFTLDDVKFIVKQTSGMLGLEGLTAPKGDETKQVEELVLQLKEEGRFIDE